MFKLLVCSVLFFILSACSTQEAVSQNSPNIQKLIQDPLTEEETVEVLDQSAKNWFYGKGIGDTAFKIGTSVVFPPIALVWLTDLGLEASGAGSVSLKAVLPEETSNVIIENYQTAISVPGKITAIVAGKEFRDQEKGEEILMNVLNRHENPVDLSDV